MIANGTKLGHYEILSALGAGGMGEVYLAEDTKLDRRVALKILPETLAQDNERMRRFVREAKSTSALNHPNIITIYEIGESDNKHFIASEYIEGETLHSRLKIWLTCIREGMRNLLRMKKRVLIFQNKVLKR